jgi:sulfite dehydrogenase (cytochrome) subunit B
MGAFACIMFVALAGLTAGAARADELAVELKPGTGLETVQDNCRSCHSLDYVPMNSPFLDAKGWDAEVTKMIKAYGAPIGEADAKTIAAYLAKNYGR